MSNMMDDFFNAPPDDFDPNAGSNPKPHVGIQIAMVKLYGPKQTQKKGVMMRTDLMIVQPAAGSSYVQGSPCGIAWWVNTSDTVNRRYERARADGFVVALLGLDVGTRPGAQAKRLSDNDQPGRGMLIKIIGGQNGAFLNYRYEHVPQTREQIVGNRAVLDRVEAAQAPAAGLPPQQMPAHMQQAVPPPQQQFMPSAPTPFAPTGFAPQVPAAPSVGIAGFPGLKF